MKRSDYVWLYLTNDKYELPILMCDTARELADKLGMSTTYTIRSSVYHAKKNKTRSRFAKVYVGGNE